VTGRSPFRDILQAYIDLLAPVSKVEVGKLQPIIDRLDAIADGEICNQCEHPIRQLECSSDWVCTQQCRCLMIGCVPRLTWFASRATLRRDVG